MVQLFVSCSLNHFASMWTFRLDSVKKRRSTGHNTPSKESSSPPPPPSGTKESSGYVVVPLVFGTLYQTNSQALRYNISRFLTITSCIE